MGKSARELISSKLIPSWAFTGMVTGGWRTASVPLEDRDRITQLARSHITLRGEWSTCPLTKSQRPSEFDCYRDPFADNFQNYSHPLYPKRKIGYFLQKQDKGRTRHTMLTKPNAYAFMAE